MVLKDYIKDSGIQLAILDQLLVSGTQSKDLLAKALRPGLEAIRGHDDFWYEENGRRLLAADECMEEILAMARDAMAGAAVSAGELETITMLQFDGGADIYMWLEGRTAVELGLEDWELDTGGESDLYQVNSFAGIDALPNLKELYLDAYGFSNKPRDLAPLTSLPRLQVIDLAGARFENAARLAEMPSPQAIRGADSLTSDDLSVLRSAGKVTDT